MERLVTLTEREGILTSGNGVKLHYRCHRLDTTPFRAVIALIEAPLDPETLYVDLVHHLAPHGYVVYGCAHHDLRQRVGRTGFLEEWNDVYLDIAAFLELVRVHEPDAAIFLAGSHEAAQLVMTYALHHPGGLHGVMALRADSNRSPQTSGLEIATRTLSRFWPAFGPVHTALPRATSAPKMASTCGAGTDLSVPALSDTVTSEIGIPVLILGDTIPASNRKGMDDVSVAATGASAHTLPDVTDWLDRVLRGQSAQGG